MALHFHVNDGHPHRLPVQQGHYFRRWDRVQDRDQQRLTELKADKAEAIG